MQACSVRYWWDKEIWSRKCSVTGYCLWRLIRRQKRRIWQIFKVVIMTKNVFCPDNFPHKTVKIWWIQNNLLGTFACIYLMATTASYWMKLYRVMAKAESQLSFSKRPLHWDPCYINRMSTFTVTLSSWWLKGGLLRFLTTWLVWIQTGTLYKNILQGALNNDWLMCWAVTKEIMVLLYLMIADYSVSFSIKQKEIFLCLDNGLK